MEAELEDEEPVRRPFTGSAERARGVFDEAIDELRARAAAAREARDAVEAASKRIQHFVYEPHFTLLATSALRARLESDVFH